MNRFCHEYFYFLEGAAGLIPIGIILANCAYYVRKAERRHKTFTETLRANKLTFDWSSANRQAKALMSKVRK